MVRYMLSDGRRYLRRDAAGNYVPTTLRELGDFFNSRVKAKNVLSSCVNKNLRARYRVEEIDIDSEADAVAEKNDATEHYETSAETMKDYLVKPKVDAAIKIANDEIAKDEVQKWSDTAESISNMIYGTETRKDALINALSEVDQEISDIYHYIEFSNLNAYQGFLAYRMLQNRLRSRRSIKDELTVLTQLGECKLNPEAIHNVKKAIDGLKNRKYEPRRLTQLFE